MITVTHSAVFVLDQEEALEFYVGKLGFEVSADVDLGVMRWLTVTPPDQPDRHILLEMPGAPAFDPDTVATLRDLVTKGAMGLTIGLSTDDIHKTYAELKAKGVEFTEEPTERFYGIDCGMRDPFGNTIRMTQPSEGPWEVPTVEEWAASDRPG